jgi:hypothetical protein
VSGVRSTGGCPATTARDQRRDWILEHWPHVVERHEITTSLEQHQWGPDRHELLDDINPNRIGDHLAAAIDADRPWLAAALTALDLDPTFERLTDNQVAWLDHVAEHRDTYGITARDPLGSIPTDPAELRAFDQLLREIHDVRIERGIELDTLDLGL